MESETWKALHSISDFGPVTDASEETFLLFARDIPSQDLGMVDGTVQTLELAVAGHDFTIHQSPGLLKSDRQEGTTGAVVWKICPLFADWIASSNVFFDKGIVSLDSTVMELGCGIGGVVGLALAPKVSKIILTDQEYVMRLLRRNVTENYTVVQRSHGRKKKAVTQGQSSRGPKTEGTIELMSLDWENTSLQHLSSFLSKQSHEPEPVGVDVVLSCDCIFNEALIEPFVRCCAAICKLRVDTSVEPTICIIAQQLRSDLVFESWLSTMLQDFHVWRIKHQFLSEALAGNPGFVVHAAVVRT